VFIEFAAEYTSSDGERVFVFNNEVYRLGVPLKIKKLPLDVTGGWRVPMGRVAPFAGAGVTFLRYEETSDFAEAEENIRKWHTGLVALAGVEVRVITNLHIRGDVRYRRIQDALGDGGVSAAFDETDLGGTGVSLKVVFGR
jgi:opacity protein-like surface antigen